MSEDFDHEPVPDYRQRLRLDGRVCAVVGGGRGIGRQTVHALSQAGAQVVVFDVDPERGRAVAGEVGAQALPMDAASPASVEAAFDELVRLHGRIDGVVDIVGGSLGAALADVDEDLIRRNFELNLFQAIHVTRVAAAAMARNGGGSVALIGSVAGLASLPNQIIYGSAKAALHHFVRCAAAELGHSGVRVNAVAPGYVKTQRMVERFDPKTWDEIAANTPLQRAGATSDIAGAALFLMQDLSAFVTGQVLVVDGGVLSPPRIMSASSSRQIAGAP